MSLLYSKNTRKNSSSLLNFKIIIPKNKIMKNLDYENENTNIEFNNSNKIDEQSIAFFNRIEEILA
jgi:hypothetical protein